MKTSIFEILISVTREPQVYQPKDYQKLFKKHALNTLFTPNVFEILLFEGGQNYHPPSGSQGEKGLNVQ